MKKKDEDVQKENTEEKIEEKECDPENCDCEGKKGQECNCEEEKEELKNQAKRALADYQNLEKRISEQKQEWIRSANRDLLLRLFPVLDTLLLANKHVEDQGLKLSVQQFLAALKQEGIEQIKTVGEKFDPHKMEGVGSTSGEKGIVIEEARPGYVLYDKVIRPAQVIVGE